VIFGEWFNFASEWLGFEVEMFLSISNQDTNRDAEARSSWGAAMLRPKIRGFAIERNRVDAGRSEPRPYNGD
jgi:hypothetical protein